MPLSRSKLSNYTRWLVNTMEKPAQINEIERDTAMLRERNAEYLVIVKNSNGELCWKASDKTWGLGAATRYIEFGLEVERCDARKAVIDEDE